MAIFPAATILDRFQAVQPLPCGEVHLWSTRLDMPSEGSHEVQPTLAPEEKEKAARFQFDLDRDRYVAGRKFLRTLLGQYLRCSPESITFRYNRYGKPELDGAAAAQSHLRFNVAHSDDWLLIGLNLHHDIGVDVERVRSELATEEVVDRFFARNEAQAWRAAPEGCRVRLFFQAWTRKEAYVKARGLGLSLPLRAFEIDLDPARPAGLMKVENGVLEAAQWSLHDVELTAGYAAAVAVAAPEVRYSSWQVNRSPLSR